MPQFTSKRLRRLLASALVACASGGKRKLPGAVEVGRTVTPKPPTRNAVKIEAKRYLWFLFITSPLRRENASALHCAGAVVENRFDRVEVHTRWQRIQIRIARVPAHAVGAHVARARDIDDMRAVVRIDVDFGM